MSLVSFPRQMLVDENGVPRVGARAYFYRSGTSTPITVYTTNSYLTAHDTPVLSESDGFFPAIYINSGDYDDYKMVVYADSTTSPGSDGTLIYSEDAIPTLAMTQAEIGEALFPLSTAEDTAGVVPSKTYRQYHREDRYATISDAISQSDNGGGPVFFTDGGLRIVGPIDSSASGATERDSAQILTKNTETSGHAIWTQVNVVNTEECAYEAVGYLDNGSYQQHGAQFWRWTGDDNGAATYKSVWALHLTGYTVDNCPLIVWSNNSILVNGGDTTTEKWTTEGEADLFHMYAKGKAGTSFTIGPNHSSTCASGFRLEGEDYAQFGNTLSNAIDKAIRLGYDTGSSTAFVEGYRNSTSAYQDITIRGTTVILTGGDTRPGTNNAYKLGTGSYRFTEVFATNGTINTSDEREKDFEEYSEAQIALAQAIKSRKLIKPFRWKSNPAKVHYGVGAQTLWALCLEFGVDPAQQGFLERDAKADTWGVNYAELGIFLQGAL